MKLKPSDHIWILGAGRFGAIAVERLSAKTPPRQIRVIDHRPDRLLGLTKGVETAAGDAIDYLVSHLEQGADPDWIVPAVPVHVAWEFIRRRLGGKVMLNAAAPDPDLLTTLPNAMAGAHGAIYASIADFLCPDNCPEPAACCTHTGQPRPMELFQAISDIAGHPFLPVVVRSHQLAPGVGGYKPAALLEAAEQVSSTDQPVLLATACRCHGVLHLLNAPQ